MIYFVFTKVTEIHNIKDDIVWVWKDYPVFKYLKYIVEKETNMIVPVAVILCQISEGSNGRREDLFNYHVDPKLARRNIKVSVIFMVTHTKSSMQMDPNTYPHKNTNTANVEMV